ncbi:MAG: hypothetical protein JXA13_00770 [Anaerolineales bacterium]|nr:hypothetical protein [Anaerolineales bacterium]
MVDNNTVPVRLFHGGWGKISAAATAQFVIAHYRPELLGNLGTCGGFDGQIAAGEIILVEKTLVYDTIEQIGDSEQAVALYTSRLELGWVPDPAPFPVRRGLFVSVDGDIEVFHKRTRGIMRVLMEQLLEWLKIWSPSGGRGINV